MTKELVSEIKNTWNLVNKKSSINSITSLSIFFTPEILLYSLKTTVLDYNKTNIYY
jgi:hypothetical protein